MTIEFKLDQISDAAARLIHFAANQTIWLFNGEMGAGKTTLIKEVCRQLGVADDMSSPTFSIVNEYRIPGGSIYHFDLYRLKDERELRDIGFEEYLDSGHFCFIEWPEKAMPFLTHKFLEIRLTANGQNTHRLEAGTIG